MQNTYTQNIIWNINVIRSSISSNKEREITELGSDVKLKLKTVNVSMHGSGSMHEGRSVHN